MRIDGKQYQKYLPKAFVEPAYDRNDPTGWFEELYSSAKGDESAIPWADLKVNSNSASWVAKQQLWRQGKLY